MSISRAQNLPANLELLSAQRRLYSDAKRSRAIRTVGSLLTAIPLPVVAVIWPDSQPCVSALGGIWLAIALVLLLAVELGRTKDATRVLEQFDVSVFGLPWNKRVAGSKVPREVVSGAARRDTDDKNRLGDWYPGIANALPHPISVLLCQRAAMVWDWRLKRSYGYAVVAATASLLLVAVLASLACDYKLSETLLVFILPMSSAFAGGVAVAASHINDARDLQEMQTDLDYDWTEALRNPESLTLADCRQHQDARFHHRLRSVPVPDCWYRRSRDRYQADMQSAAERMVGEFREALEIRSTT